MYWIESLYQGTAGADSCCLDNCRLSIFVDAAATVDHFVDSIYLHDVETDFDGCFDIDFHYDNCFVYLQYLLYLAQEDAR